MTALFAALSHPMPKEPPKLGKHSVTNIQTMKPETKSECDWPYEPPTLRGRPTIQRFIGAVHARIQMRQKALWSRFIGAGFIAEDITAVWPEENLDFFGMRHSGLMRGYRLSDLNLRELEELLKWLIAKYEFDGRLSATDPDKTFKTMYPESP